MDLAERASVGGLSDYHDPPDGPRERSRATVVDARLGSLARCESNKRPRLGGGSEHRIVSYLTRRGDAVTRADLLTDQ